MLTQTIQPRDAGVLSRLASRFVPAFLASYLTKAVAHMLRLLVYLPFVLWFWGRHLGTVPELGPLGNVLVRRLFSLPDCSAGALSLFSWLLLTDEACRRVLDVYMP